MQFGDERFSIVSIHDAHINEEFSILSDLEAAFNNYVSLILCSMYLAIFFTLIDFQLIEDLLEVAKNLLKILMHQNY